MNKIFLATTAREDFWDTSYPIVFLGLQCCLYSRRTYWKKLNGKVVKSPFNDLNLKNQSSINIDITYEKLLAALGRELNTAHKVKYSLRYWRILIGPWLHTYISTIYDAFYQLRAAENQFPNYETIILAKDSFVVPTDTADYYRLLRLDSYHLQIYSKILNYLGRKFPERSIPKTPIKSRNNNYLEAAKSLLLTLYTKVVKNYFSGIFLRDSYFSRCMEFRFMLSFPGKFFPIIGQFFISSTCDLDESIRKRNFNSLSPLDEFEECLFFHLWGDIPSCFLEECSVTRSDALGRYPNEAKVIFSSNAWYTDELFKFWAAESSERGAKILASQHGGTYGIVAYIPSELHEIAISDTYYTWGWKSPPYPSKIIPMPSCILIGRKRVGANNHNNGILWVPTQHERYQLWFPYLPEDALVYIDCQIRFARSLRNDIFKEVCIRHKPLDYGWSLSDRLNDFFPEIKINSHKTPFLESLERCRLYVCDHLSTTFIEALFIDKPTVLFWDESITPVRECAASYLNLLREEGILFSSPEEAANVINENYVDIESWWNEPSRKSAVRKFCAQYASMPLGAIEIWEKEFRRQYSAATT